MAKKKQATPTRTFSDILMEAHLDMLRQITTPPSLYEDPKTPAVDLSLLEKLKAVEPHRVTKRIPDYMQVVTAWRAWSVVHSEEGLRLQSLGQNHIWQPKKPMAAKCEKSSGMVASIMMPRLHPPQARHAAPHFNCECGIWAFKSLDALVQTIESGTYSPIQVLGSVSLWGRYVETENGWRAQYGYPSELWIFDNALEELGMIYDVPVRMV